ncbi:MAG: DegT/DnrJ/EryC1/StrS aminotransferase family protein [Flavobacteriales bacterium]|nr:DegT/DnrJ/EryC1/StrS aminotransferase family protein [Flavobacteriales bacterium]MCX7767616.1 DegT/DnrJ/EryC1/StrS aminotransferase family protein [Flavobacteriales bacterium]MDW8409542.1 DegT/DnrJ/EryC1/StrS aminotransferase family protein [Flavobacteriales bacterium]
MRYAFLEEQSTRKALAEFILTAPRLSMDEQCRRFEEAFSQHQGRTYSVFVNSGASANLILLQALKNLGRLKTGDKIGFSALTWSTNTMPIEQLGFVPVPVDCNPATMNVHSAQLEDRLRQAPDMKAFFATNVLGFTGDLNNIRQLCEQRGIIFLEDNCESMGSELPEGKAGNFGLAATFSFFVAHHMSTIEGGMVCTDDPELAEMLLIVRANGWDRNLPAHRQQALRQAHGISSEFKSRYTFYHPAYNVRPTEITAYLGLLQLQHVASTYLRRQENFQRVEKWVRSNPDFIPFDYSHMKLLSAFSLSFLCRSEELRDAYVQRFIQNGIEVRPLIAGNMGAQPYYKKYIGTEYPLPGADTLDRCGFYCGNFPTMTEEDFQLIASSLQPIS